MDARKHLDRRVRAGTHASCGSGRRRPACVPARTLRARARGAFTLVELLTVIVIIGILAALISAAVVGAVRKAKQAKVTLEITTMSQQVNLLRDTFGDYPPSNLSDAASVRAFLRRAFPRYPASGADPYTQFVTDLSGAGLTVGSMDAAAALVFWLGGVPDATGRLTGFSQDKERPFQLGGARIDPSFDFNRDRLRIGSGTMRYYPDITGAPDADAPYVYFRSSDYPTAFFNHNDSGTAVVLKPYVNNRNPSSPEYANLKSFQIISAGMDNMYGGTSGSASPTFPSGNFSTPGHYDNLTNFTDGKIEDAMQ